MECAPLALDMFRSNGWSPIALVAKNKSATADRVDPVARKENVMKALKLMMELKSILVYDIPLAW